MEQSTQGDNHQSSITSKLDDEIKKISYWVGQSIMLVATVLGVFLAAQVGLRQAIIFDDIASKESNYYLRQSLYQEVSDNVDLLRTYNDEYLGRNVPKQTLLANHPKISYYVWETMKFSPFTLETPSHFLSESRAFYDLAEDLIAKREAGILGASFVKKLMNDKLDHVEKNVLPLIKANTDKLASELADYDVPVESVALEDNHADMP
ncbi:hypothetical protein N9P41_00535 [Pseudomonadales bacterium]|nr:hypothetical protein [Pseudomonadales bacterium]